jgi:2-keto-3-deoxy-galactonokinase
MWGETAYRVWLPTKDAVVRARSQDLAQLDSIQPTVEHILHTAAAAKLLDAWRTTCCWRPSSPAWSRCRTSSMRSTAR